MNNFTSMQQVLQRISSIEQRFGVVTKPMVTAASGTEAVKPASDFSSLFSAVQQQGNSGVNTSSYEAGSEDVIRMIQLAAQKYGVDPKLAQAVAKAESGYSPNALSSTGAVGVMQLMPDTAAGLGVRNINDPRENIDGGVQYLKQMLDTFHGNVSQAVAAYNAGPQAVKDYQGIPPYSETQAYVANVLSYYKNF